MIMWDIIFEFHSHAVLAITEVENKEDFKEKFIQLFKVIINIILRLYV